MRLRFEVQAAVRKMIDAFSICRHIRCFLAKSYGESSLCGLIEFFNCPEMVSLNHTDYIVIVNCIQSVVSYLPRPFWYLCYFVARPGVGRNGIRQKERQNSNNNKLSPTVAVRIITRITNYT